MSKNKPSTHQQSVTYQKASLYQGPLPKPEDLQHYEQISPGFADRIVRLTESEALHRRGFENRVLKYNFSLTLLGQFFGLTSIAGVLSLCYYAFSLGFATQAATIAVGVLVSIGSVFLFRRKQKPE